jgi:uncharacterized protein YcsI (UPF0317 family)
MVTFYYGCSFSLEGIAESAGVGFRSVAKHKYSPLILTSIPLANVSVFKGATMVVSMRPCQRSSIEKLVQALAPCEVGHGAPIHIGDPSIIGINDVAERLIFGDMVELHDDEVPVFWACGVSATQMLLHAGNVLNVQIECCPTFYVQISCRRASTMGVRALSCFRGHIREVQI